MRFVAKAETEKEARPVDNGTEQQRNQVSVLVPARPGKKWKWAGRLIDRLQETLSSSRTRQVPANMWYILKHKQGSDLRQLQCLQLRTVSIIGLYAVENSVCQLSVRSRGFPRKYVG